MIIIINVCILCALMPLVGQQGQPLDCKNPTSEIVTDTVEVITKQKFVWLKRFREQNDGIGDGISVHCMSVWLSCAVYCCTTVCLSCVLCCCRAVCVWSLIFSADCIHSVCEMFTVDGSWWVLFDLIALCMLLCVVEMQTDRQPGVVAQMTFVNCELCQPQQQTAAAANYMSGRTNSYNLPWSHLSSCYVCVVWTADRVTMEATVAEQLSHSGVVTRKSSVVKEILSYAVCF